MAKPRTLTACSLKHSMKKDMISVMGKTNLLRSSRGGGGRILSFLFPARGYAPAYDTYNYDIK